MNIRTPTSGIEPHRFATSSDVADAGRLDTGLALDRSADGAARSSDALDGEAILGMDVWTAAGSRSLDASVPASSISIGADAGAAIERTVDYILAPLS